MQFSIRTLLIAVVIVAIPFGAVEIYNSMWEAHCRKLEPSLFRTVLENEETERQNENPLNNSQPATIFWGILTPEEGLVSPDPELVQEIGLKYVLPASEAAEADVVYITKIRWIDWETVIVNHGSYSHADGSSVVFDQKLKYKDGKWEYADIGSP